MIRTVAHHQDGRVGMWEIRHDGQLVMRLYIRCGVDPEIYPDSAVMLLKSTALSAREACTILAYAAGTSPHASIAFEMLAEYMSPIVAQGSSGEFDTMLVCGDSEEAAYENFQTLLESPMMGTPLIEIVQ